MPQSTFSFFKRTLTKALSLAMPSPCLLCSTQSEQLLCQDCMHQYFSSSPPRCTRCAIFTSGQTVCGECLSDPPPFDHTLAACDYVAPIDQLVLSLKFGHRLAVAKVFAQRLAQTVLTSSLHHDLPDFIIAVPLSEQRLAERGFNQATEIAKPLAAELNRPFYRTALIRTRDTRAQALLETTQRQKNILHAFLVGPRYLDKIRGRHIGVVDDVLTTGATLRAVAHCLKSAGAHKVSNFVFARTPRQ